jgi:2-oxoglutarate/2-oxoacid ferredoxin oxidoreductase subunit beta
MSSSIAPLTQLTRKDYLTDQEVRWCPGCGDYSILANVQRVMPELGIPLEKMVWVSGIGCSSRFPYYMNTYGFHTIHGRAPAFAMGIKVANPELSVWIATGDGDGLSIGGNHLMHCIRRNLDVKILLFNNRIYGLTKGQYSPTSEFGKVTKSTPSGSADQPLDPASFAIGCGGSFVARSIDTDAAHLGEMLRRAGHHGGTAFVEIYQNCNVFNDGAFDSFTDKDKRAERQLRVEHNKPLLFGVDNTKGLRINPRNLSLEVVTIGENGITADDVIVHDETSATLAYMLARMPYPQFPVAVGVLYAVSRPTYDGTLREQQEAAKQKFGDGDLAKLLNSGNTWQV